MKATINGVDFVPEHEARLREYRLIEEKRVLLEACDEAHALLYHYDLVRQPNGVDWGPVEMLRQETIDKLWHALEYSRAAQPGAGEDGG